jgi:NAD(P)-dependent dehydrogenase (short-subunit alcohol dehydrogenase family)
MSKYLADKVIAVTGAGSGFGKLIAQKCAAGGAKVVGIDINDESLSKAAPALPLRPPIQSPR